MPEVQSTGGGNVQKRWDPFTMFEVSPEELELMKKRKEMAAVRKTEFRLIKSNPANIVNGGIGGHIVDPQMQRWDAARATFGDYFKVNRKNTTFAFLVYILPMVVLYKVASSGIRKRDEANRRGDIPTKEKAYRSFLFM